MMEGDLSIKTKQNKDEAKNAHDSRELCTRSTGLGTTCLEAPKFERLEEIEKLSNQHKVR